MDYVLVEDQTTVIFGPGQWKPRFIQADVDALDIDYKVSPTPPNGYLKIADNLEVYPVVLTSPPFDALFQELAGPFWNFDNQVATGYYTVQDRNIDWIKGDLKQILARVRYEKEIGLFQTTVQNTTITLDTSRENRGLYLEKYLVMGDTDTVLWKFPEAWLTLSKLDLGTIVANGAGFIQGVFVWESETATQIDAAVSIDDLKAIYAAFLPPPPEREVMEP